MLKTHLVLLLATATLSHCVKDVPPRTGGYSNVTDTREVRRAADFAVRQQAAQSGEKLSLADIVQAEQLAVGGTNHRMTLRVRAGREIRFARAMVYESLAPQQMLMSWEWIDPPVAAVSP